MKNMNKIKGFVFDFDNTILDSDKLILKAFKNAYKDVTNKDIELKEIIANYGPSEEGMFLKLINDKDEAKKAFNLYLSYYEIYQKELFTSLKPFYYEIFSKIKEEGYKLFIVTGRSEESLKLSLSYFNLNKYIDKYYFGSLEGVNKPDSFKKLEIENNLNNEELVYFGDSFNDIKSCKTANILLYSVGIYYDKSYQEGLEKRYNKNYVIHDENEFKEVILKLIYENK